MNPDSYSDLDYGSSGAREVASWLLKPLLLAQDIRTDPEVLGDLTLNSPVSTIRATAARNSSTPLVAYAKWLLNEEEEHPFDGRKNKLKILSIRMDGVLVDSGCVLSDITKLPLSWKLRMLEAL